ncbi:MAG: hypothetical protein M0Q87_11295 [Ottowia sp.]|nr:hypothetical protein [Ottowia sp.]
MASSVQRPACAHYAQRPTLNAQRSTLNAQRSTLNAQPPHQRSTSPSTLNLPINAQPPHQRSTSPSTLNLPINAQPPHHGGTAAVIAAAQRRGHQGASEVIRHARGVAFEGGHAKPACG